MLKENNYRQGGMIWPDMQDNSDNYFRLAACGLFLLHLPLKLTVTAVLTLETPSNQ